MIRVKRKAVWIMCLLFILFGVVSALTTYVGITYLSLSEANPFMAEMFTKYGMVTMLVIKLLIVSVLGVSIAIIGTHPRTWKSFSFPSLICLSVFATITLANALANIIAIILEVILR